MNPDDLVTGGAGFIGSHVVRRLLADAARVRELPGWEPEAPYVEGLRWSVACFVTEQST